MPIPCPPAPKFLFAMRCSDRGSAIAHQVHRADADSSELGLFVSTDASGDELDGVGVVAISSIRGAGMTAGAVTIAAGSCHVTWAVLAGFPGSGCECATPIPSSMPRRQLRHSTRPRRTPFADPFEFVPATGMPWSGNVRAQNPAGSGRQALSRASPQHAMPSTRESRSGSS